MFNNSILQVFRSNGGYGVSILEISGPCGRTASRDIQDFLDLRDIQGVKKIMYGYARDNGKGITLSKKGCSFHSEEDKKLAELFSLVTTTYVFNKNCGRFGGLSLEDLEIILKDARLETEND